MWSTRYFVGAGFDGGSDFLVWRDPGEPGERFDCGLFDHPWFPLEVRDMALFDEEEAVVLVAPCQVLCEPDPLFRSFPAQANRVTAGSEELPLLFDLGWTVVDLNSADEDVFRQAWMGLVGSAEGRYSVGFDAIALDSSCNAGHVLVGGGF